MQGLIPSLTPMYEAVVLLCGGKTWTGDIFAIRRALGQNVDGQRVTQQLTSLQRRGMLTFTYEKQSHKRITWTITLTQVNQLSEEKKRCERCKEREVCPSNGTYCRICQQVEIALNALRYVRSKKERTHGKEV